MHIEKTAALRASEAPSPTAASLPLARALVPTSTIALVEPILSGGLAPAALPVRFRVVSGDYAVHALRLIGDMQVHCVVELDRHVDERRLARAVRLALDAEPILGCRLVPGLWRARWERRSDLDSLPLCTLERSSAPERSVVDFLATATHPTRDPLVRARIVRSDAADIVCVKVDHTVADGGGTKDVAYLVAAMYEALGADPAFLPTPNGGGSRSMGQVAQVLGLRGRLGALRRYFRDLPLRTKPARFWTMPMRGTPSSAAGRTYVLHSVDSTGFAAVRALATRYDATINDLLVAAYLCALRELFPSPPGAPLRAQTTVDLRRYLPGGRAGSICNLSGFAYLRIDPATRGFSAMIGAVRSTMRAHKADHIGVGDWTILPAFAKILPAPLMPGVFRRLFFAGGSEERPRPSMFPPAFTNIGRIDPARLRFGDARTTQAYATASVIFPPAFAMAATGFGDSLTFSAGFCESAIEREKIAALFARMAELLTTRII